MNTHKLVLRLGIFSLVIALFVLGWQANSLYGALNSSDLEKPTYLSLLSQNEPKEVPSPADHIKQEQIHVFDDKIIIDLPNANWAKFTDSNSMDPLFDADANSFEIKPNSPEDIQIGDIISYKSEYATGLTIHRVIETGEDEQGWFSIVKGDNLTEPDPGKIRFNQIHGILVGVIY